jgi:dihydrofolate synthase/folylpolyglutamate synthase
VSLSYSETLTELFARLPMFQRVGKAAYKANLDNTWALMEAFDHPEKSFPSIHIAGTNGKGSVSSGMCAMLAEAGYKVGLYTSPHLLDFRERIQIGGTCIPEASVIEFYERVSPLLDQLTPSFFEITVAMAFDYFRKEEVDVAVIEVGLGGRLDSTNVVQSILGAIVSIGHDHMDLLGDTLEKVALEKAGIAKQGLPMVLGPNGNESDAVLMQETQRLGAKSIWAEPAPSSWIQAFALKGSYQVHNVSVLYSMWKCLPEPFQVTEERALKGLAEVRKWSQIRGRWEVLQAENPFVVCDTGHNAEALQHTLAQFQAHAPVERCHFVWGAVGDKDLQKVLSMLPAQAHYYWCCPSIPRGLPAIELQSRASEMGLTGSVYDSVSDAYLVALSKASEGEAVYVGGSTFVVADLLAHLQA